MLHLLAQETEGARLASLKEYRILDSEPEPSFDDIVSLASLICETPISLVSFVDEERQWFKAKKGLDLSQISRSISFCSHAIGAGVEVFEVSDASRDARFSDNPLVVGEPGIRFYAGAVLTVPSGALLGTVCVIDRKARTLSDVQKAALAAFARQVVMLLEQRRQRYALEMSAKMKTLGEMTSGIAHEINNPISVITGKCYVLMQKIQDRSIDFSGIQQVIESISKTSYRVAKIIKGLREFAAGGASEKVHRTRLGEVIEDAIEMSRTRLISSGVEMQVAEIPMIEVEWLPVQISQVLLNIFCNAVDVIDEQGLSPSDRWIRLSFRCSADRVVIIVTNSGPLISPEVRTKIMQPFFTTKPTGKGVGLGLSISKGLIERQGGSLTLSDSDPNTTFLIDLPLSAADFLGCTA